MENLLVDSVSHCIYMAQQNIRPEIYCNVNKLQELQSYIF
jgi:hypothetical protein